MASITFFVLLAILIGLYFSYLVARTSTGSGPSRFLSSAGKAVLLGFALVLTAGFLNELCLSLLKVCSPTTDTTVFHMSYPVMAAPLYWIVMLFTPQAGTAEKNTSP